MSKDSSTDFNWRGVGRGPSIPAQHGSAMHQKESGAEHTARIVKECADARQREDAYALVVHLYCCNNDCPVRGFSLDVTAEDGSGYDLVHAFACPYCGRFAVLDADQEPAVETASEADRREEQEARRSVWRQIQTHRHGGPVPISVADFDQEVDIAELARLLDEAADGKE